MNFIATDLDIPLRNKEEVEQYVRFNFDPSIAKPIYAKIDELAKKDPQDWDELLDEAIANAEVPDLVDGTLDSAAIEKSRHLTYLLDGAENPVVDFPAMLALMENRRNVATRAITEETLKRSIKTFREGDPDYKDKVQSLVELNVCCCTMREETLWLAEQPDLSDIPETVKAIIRVVLKTVGIDVLYSVIIGDADSVSLYVTLGRALRAGNTRQAQGALTRIVDRIARNRTFQRRVERTLGRRVMRRSAARVLAKFVPILGWAIFVGSLLYFLWEEWDNIFGKAEAAEFDAWVKANNYE
ncbi:MAG: hypothetical protein AAFR73_05720 [Pseudomonadota bacterium]